MLAFVIVLQVLVALFLILVVLLQPGNRGGASAALGGAGSDTVFGARGANTFLSKLTFGAAVCFMMTNIALSYMSSLSGSNASVFDKAGNVPAATKPSTEPVANPDANAPAPTDADDLAKPTDTASEGANNDAAPAADEPKK